MQTQKPGILLINTGTPDSPEIPEVRRYLRQFLWDYRVIDMHPVARWLLLNLVILPTRPKHSSEAYKKIWTDRGSPLIFHSEDLRDGLREKLPTALIEIGMAYGKPSIPDAIDSLLEQGATRIVLVPMFPQYASATVGGVLEVSYKTLSEKMNVPPITTVAPFYNHPAFLDAWVALSKPKLDAFKPEHVLLSYHGLPERHIKNCDPTGSHCLQKDGCCDNYLDANPHCYRAQCYATTKGLVERLGIAPENYSHTFQSKLGKDPWLTPATDTTVAELAKKGIRRLAVLSPAFVADCIETDEELGIQTHDSFMENGGEELELLSSLNAKEEWVDAFAQILQENL